MFNKLLKSIKLLLNPPEFIIKIKGGKAEMITGKLPKPFIDELLELCKKNLIGYTKISGINSENGVRLEFSESIPENLRQRIRNLYGIYK
jgi:hypothetical protein